MKNRLIRLLVCKCCKKQIEKANIDGYCDPCSEDMYQYELDRDRGRDWDRILNE